MNSNAIFDYMKHVCKQAFCIAVIPFIVISCSEDLKPNPPKYHELLTGKTSKTWALASYTLITRQDNFEYIFFDGRSDCNSEDYELYYRYNYYYYYTFYNNSARTLEITEGPKKCSNFKYGNYNIADYWALENASATLTFVLPPFVDYARVPFIIKDLSDRRLIVEYFDDKYIHKFTLNPIKE